MGKNKNEQVVTEAADIFEELRQVEVSVANNIKLSKRELIQTRYYKKFILKTIQGSITLRNLFITIEKDLKEKISYHFRWLDKKLSMIEENIFIKEGNVYTTPELKDIIGNIVIDIEELIKENDKESGNLKGISEKLNPEQIKKIFEKEYKKEAAELGLHEDEEKYAHQIETDLAKQGEIVKIGQHIQIKDHKITETVPGIFEKGKKHVVAEDKENGSYIIVEREKGHFKKNEEILPGRFTSKRIFSIGPDGEQKEIEIPEQIMDIHSYSTKKISIQRDEEGVLLLQIVKVTSCHNIK